MKLRVEIEKIVQEVKKYYFGVDNNYNDKKAVKNLLSLFSSTIKEAMPKATGQKALAAFSKSEGKDLTEDLKSVYSQALKDFTDNLRKKGIKT